MSVSTATDGSKEIVTEFVAESTGDRCRPQPRRARHGSGRGTQAVDPRSRLRPCGVWRSSCMNCWRISNIAGLFRACRSRRWYRCHNRRRWPLARVDSRFAEAWAPGAEYHFWSIDPPPECLVFGSLCVVIVHTYRAFTVTFIPPMATSFFSISSSSSVAPGGGLPTAPSKLFSILSIGAVLLLAAGSSFGVTATKPHRTHHPAPISSRFHWRLSKWNPMFPGSHQMLVQQNEELNRLQLPRIFDDNELMRLELSQDLLRVQETDALKFASELPENRRYCRPWTRDFLQDFSQAFYTQFHTPIQVNSLVRTVEQQHKLR